MSLNFNQHNHVVVCIPYYKSQKYIRRAVDSLLVQTHSNLTVVVLNDADFETPPWPMLADITDHRLIRFDLSNNRGPFFATQILLEVTTSPYFLIQDSDDWSHPERIAQLLNAIEYDNADFAVSAQPQIVERSDGINEIIELRWIKKVNNQITYTDSSTLSRFHINTMLTPKFRYRSPHHGLFRTSTLRNLGGYHPGYRINFDSLIPNLILMVGKISHVSLPLYYRFIRKESLTHSEATGIDSFAAKKELETTKFLYSKFYTIYEVFLKGQLDSKGLFNAFKKIFESTISPDLNGNLLMEIKRFQYQNFNQQF